MVHAPTLVADATCGPEIQITDCLRVANRHRDKGPVVVAAVAANDSHEAGGSTVQAGPTNRGPSACYRPCPQGQM
jgi:hypothetical protein